MATKYTKGHPVQIICFENGEMKLNSEKLREILTQSKVKDLPVVPVSIAGKKRQGKSLMLSNFLRYSQLQGSQGWLSDDHGPLEGFVFKSGSTGVTTGIYIWSELFVVKMRTNKKVAVMFMDTQGSFDTRCDLKESSVVFALSTTISSVQIYNISKFLAGDDLHHLQMFIEYGKLAQKYAPDSSGVFQSLQILVRDWMDTSEADYGYEGGQQHLNKVLEVEAGESATNKALVNDITSSFSMIGCFLMPEPEKCVRDGTFDGTPSKMGDDFSMYLRDFVEHILHPSQLVLKQQAGRVIKTCQLLYQFEIFAKIFNEKMPSAQSLIEGMAESSYLIAIDEAMSVFIEMADKEFGPGKPSLSEDRMTSLIEKLHRATVNDFMKSPMMGGKALEDKYRKILNEKIDKGVTALKNANLIRSQEERKIQESIEKHQRLVQELEDRHLAETLDAQERAKERELLNERRHHAKMKQMQEEFETRWKTMSEEERKRAQEELACAKQQFKEQADRERAESERQLRENQLRADEKLQKMVKENNEKVEKLLRQQQPSTSIIQDLAEIALNVASFIPGGRNISMAGRALLTGLNAMHAGQQRLT